MNNTIVRLNKNLELLKTRHPETYKKFTELTVDPLFGIFTGRKIPNQRSVAILANTISSGRGAVLLAGIAADLQKLQWGKGGFSQIAVEIINLPASPQSSANMLIEETVKFVIK